MSLLIQCTNKTLFLSFAFDCNYIGKTSANSNMNVTHFGYGRAREPFRVFCVKDGKAHLKYFY